jgi:hypothetical protein
VKSTTPLFIIGLPKPSIPSIFKFPIGMLEQLTYMVAIMTCLFLCSSAPLDRGQSTVFIYPLYSRIEHRRYFWLYFLSWVNFRLLLTAETYLTSLSARWLCRLRCLGGNEGREG